MVSRRWWYWLFVVGLVLALPQGPALGKMRGFKKNSEAIQIQLKVQSITKENFFLGDVWVAPDKFTDVQIGTEYVGYARAVGFDRMEKQVEISPNWQPGDPAMVEVNPTKGHSVKITVLKAGQSDLTVSVGRIAKVLQINATYSDGAMQVEISQ